jgi:hypothetical protein
LFTFDLHDPTGLYSENQEFEWEISMLCCRHTCRHWGFTVCNLKLYLKWNFIWCDMKCFLLVNFARNRIGTPVNILNYKVIKNESVLSVQKTIFQENCLVLVLCNFPCDLHEI